jgi:hypothetical protein
MGTIVVILLMIGATIYWILQIACLMRMSDGDFCGRFDKPLWVAILLFSFVFGALAFSIWKSSVIADERVKAVTNRIGAMIQEGQKPDAPQ